MVAIRSELGIGVFTERLKGRFKRCQANTQIFRGPIYSAHLYHLEAILFHSLIIRQLRDFFKIQSKHLIKFRLDSSFLKKNSVWFSYMTKLLECCAAVAALLNQRRQQFFYFISVALNQLIKHCVFGTVSGMLSKNIGCHLGMLVVGGFDTIKSLGAVKTRRIN